MAGLLVVVAIFFNAIAPFAHRPSPYAALQGSPGVVLCTALGVETIAVDRTGKSPEAPAKIIVSYCPICAAAQLAGIFLPPALQEIHAPRHGTAVPYVVTDGFSAFHLQHLGFESRAPPPSV